MTQAALSVLPPRAGDVRRAIIDIGSNTVRMVIYGGPPRAPAVLFNEKVTARLGKGVGETGRLSPKSMATALSALSRFAVLLRMHGVRDIETVATAAARDAVNGGEFLEQVAALGLTPRLLSGEEEAVASGHGVLSAFPGAKGIVGDLGGGSLELIDIAADRCSHGMSMPLGTLRLPALRADGPTKFNRRVAKMLASEHWQGEPGQTLYLVGGSLRAFGRFAMVQQAWPTDDPHGFELSPDEALRAVRALSSRRADAPPLPPIAGVSSGRMASLPDAGALLGVLVRELQPSRLVFSGWGLREGLLSMALSPQVARQDPLIAGVSAFVEAQEPGMTAMATRLALWTRALGSGQADGLRRAATMLALASLRTEPNLRAEQAAQWALRKRWIGLDAPGRAMIAMAVLANNGKTSIAPELMRLAPLEALEEARCWGLAIRLARRLTGGMAEAFDGTALSIEGEELVLNIIEPCRSLYGEASAKDLRVLAEALQLRPVMNVVPQLG